MDSLTSLEFVQRWSKSTLSERASAQSHFNDLCKLLGQKTPTEVDPDGDFYTFEKAVNKSGSAGGKGFADVWYKDHFAVEYKGKHKDLKAAYDQLLRYREDLGNPPLLVVCDISRFEIHTNFTNSVKKVYTFTNEEVPDNFRILKALFEDPDSLAPSKTTESVTREAAEGFAQLSDGLRSRGEDPERAAHFLNKLLFCLFGEDVGLLPKDIFSEILNAASQNPEWFVSYTKDLFRSMSTGGHMMLKRIRHFNGGLFADDEVLPLSNSELKVLARVSKLDWGSVEPAIFGTFFERSLDPAMRSKLGAHYTSKEDILTLIEPVLMAPLREEWEQAKSEAQKAADSATGESGRKRENRLNAAKDIVYEFTTRLRAVRVLDPACGSGNFLYMALRQMLDLEKEVASFASTLDDTDATQLNLDQYVPQVSPDQLYGMELSPYAHELAQVVVWIGYLQWLSDNGVGAERSPVLGNMSNIRQMDAILAYDADGNPTKPEWPEAEYIVGNPPFLGAKKFRSELSDNYSDALFRLYGDRVPGMSDLVCYWFERAREYVSDGGVKRAGLISTNSIRGGRSREVLRHINESGNIFFAESDRPWVQNGASVRVSMVGFDSGLEQNIILDGVPVRAIHSDLTGKVDLSAAAKLAENSGMGFIGDVKGGKFDVPGHVAREWIERSANPNGRSNSEVLMPWMNSLDITRRNRDMWIIDFGLDMSEKDARRYTLPYEYVEQHVKPVRTKISDKVASKLWWRHTRPVPGMRTAIADLDRFIVTPTVAKHRVFTWLESGILPDHQLVVFGRDDDYFMGVLHSRAHELWSLRMGTSLEDRPRYTPTTCLETFPLPWCPGTEPLDDQLLREIADAAKQLTDDRQNYLHPAGKSEPELKKHTLTNLYNEFPAWLRDDHEDLNRAVFAAYGWEPDVSDDDILTNLLALNAERAAG